MLCYKVSSRGYFVSSDDKFVCSVISYSEVKIGLETPKETGGGGGGGKVSEKTSFQVGVELQKVYKQGVDEKASRTLPHYGMMPSP